MTDDTDPNSNVRLRVISACVLATTCLVQTLFIGALPVKSRLLVGLLSAGVFIISTAVSAMTAQTIPARKRFRRRSVLVFMASLLIVTLVVTPLAGPEVAFPGIGLVMSMLSGFVVGVGVEP